MGLAPTSVKQSFVLPSVTFCKEEVQNSQDKASRFSAEKQCDMSNRILHQVQQCTFGAHENHQTGGLPASFFSLIPGRSAS